MAADKSIGGHRLLRLLGEGGMGRVYLAEDETLGRRAALKIVSERFAAHSEARARFLREARAMAKVEHPHVVRVYAFGETADAPYLVMEYVDGETLATRMRREGRVSIDEALRIVRQVAEALEAAWERRLVHRDIKPSNILLDAKGSVHVADFGLAKPAAVADSSESASLTASGSVLGTPYYVSPEQARGEPVDFRSDIYSLGVVLYELLCGQHPFEGGTPFEIVARHIRDPLPSLKPRCPQATAPLEDLVTWMTRKEPSARPESYAALLAGIDALSEARVAGSTPSIRPHQRKRFARRRLLAAIVAASAIATGWLVWHARRGHRTSTPKGDRLVVAVAPFYGPDEDSAKEGLVTAALIEKALAQRLPSSGTTVLGVEETKLAVRDHAAARDLGKRLQANLVVWGETFVVRGETEIQPYFTLVPRPQLASRNQGLALLARDPAADLRESAGQSVVVEAQAPNQIELRRSGAARVGDLALLLAGAYALYVEDRPEEALRLFHETPRGSEMLRYCAEAFIRLDQNDRARQALEDAAALSPEDGQAWASLGDVHMKAGRLAAAVAAYHRAANAGDSFHTREAILFEGRLYAKETYPNPTDPKAEEWASGYLLALDPATGVVRERHYYPGSLHSLSVGNEGLRLEGREGTGQPASFTLTISGGRVHEPVPLSSGTLYRRRSIYAGRVLAANFLPGPGDTGFRARGDLGTAPRTLVDLEVALKAARRRDPTQPWYLFYLGQAEWSQGRRAEADETWREMFESVFPAIPYYEYSWMAADFEELGQPDWADRAYAEALRRRRDLPQPIGSVTLLERVVSARFSPVAARGLRHRPPSPSDLERGYLWLKRAREFGPVSEGEDLAAAAWAAYFAERGDEARAAAERALRDRMQWEPLNALQDAARWDYAFQFFLATTLALWILLSLLLRNTRTRRLAPKRERRMALAAALSILLASYMGLAVATDRFDTVMHIWIGWGDALNSPATIQDLERRMAEVPTDELHFLLGAAHHLAGHTDRARLLYQSLGDDPRAQKNLAALRSGAPVPPELNDRDIAEAYLARPWHVPVAVLWRAGFLRHHWTIESVLPVEMAAALGVLLGLLLLLTDRPRAAVGVTTVPAIGRRTRLAERIVPGLDDLRSGRLLRGQVALTLFLFCVVAVSTHALASWNAGFPSVGFLTGAGVPMAAHPLPTPLRFWPLFWTYRAAPWFWTLVGIAFLASLALQLPRRRREVDGDAPTRTSLSAGTESTQTSLDSGT